MIHIDDRDLLEAYLDLELDAEKLKAVELRLCTEEDLARFLVEISCEESILREWSDLQRIEHGTNRRGIRAANTKSSQKALISGSPYI